MEHIVNNVMSALPIKWFTTTARPSSPASPTRAEDTSCHASAFKPAFDARLLAQGLHEVLGETPAAHSAAVAFVLAAVSPYLRDTSKPLLAIALKTETQEQGCLHGAGLSAFGIDAAHVIAVTARTEKELLWAAEEGAGCAGLGAVVAVMGRRERVYGFTASLRLKLRLQRAGLPVFILRPSQIETTAATARWRVRPLSSVGQSVPGSSLPLPGQPRLSVCLERYAGLPPQTWALEIDKKHGLHAIDPSFPRDLSSLKSSSVDATGVRRNNSA